MHSWRNGTEKQYSPHIKNWLLFCKEAKIDPCVDNVPHALEYLSDLFEKGSSYDKIKTARSALSTIIAPINNLTFGRLPIVKRFMKGVFERRPTFPRNLFIWDVSILFDHFRSLPVVEELPLKTLSKKLAILMSLASGGQRVQTLHRIELENIHFLNDRVIIPITSLIKQSRPSRHMALLVFKTFDENKLCVVQHLTCYLKMTENRRTTQKLFIGYVKPFKAVSRDTISRWCKTMLSEAGIDTKHYTSHSSRSAAPSKSKSGIPIKEILKNAGWSNERTFATRYDKTVIEDINLLNILNNGNGHNTDE